MKFLCICEGGNVRSVAMAQIIKESGHEAIAIGSKYASLKTFELLFAWADKTIDMRDIFPEDLWHNPRHPNLKKEVKKIWKYMEKHL